jgi:hypothetical protein
LVEDQDLERSLRSQCELVITRLYAFQGEAVDLLVLLKEKLIPGIRLLDLNGLTPKNVQSYPPKLLMQMCLGYLKLSNLDESGKIRAFLVDKKNALCTVVEEWLQGDTPMEMESSRVMVKFLTKLEIPNQVLCDWLTVKSEVYQKTNDLLLSYIADNWTHEKLQVGEYLVAKAAQEGSDRTLLGVFIPILERVH